MLKHIKITNNYSSLPFIRPLSPKAIPLTRPLPPKATTLTRPDFRCTVITKFCSIVPLKRGHTHLIKPYFYCRRIIGLIIRGLLYIHCIPDIIFLSCIILCSFRCSFSKILSIIWTNFDDFKIIYSTM